MENEDIIRIIFRKAVSNDVADFSEKYGFDLLKWKQNIDNMHGRSRKTINKFFGAYDTRIDMECENSTLYEKIIFA